MTYIHLENIEFYYSPEKIIFKNISLQLKSGEFTVMMGLNGCGKTTLGKLMVGILQPVSGHIYIGGQGIEKYNLSQIGIRIGYLFQNPEQQLFTTTVEEELAFPMRFRGEEKSKIITETDKMLELFMLTKYRHQSPWNLSRGEKKRLAMASILINRPKYLILDEPNSGLDTISKNNLKNIFKKLKEQGIGIFLITHDSKFIEKEIDQLITVKGGQLIAQH